MIANHLGRVYPLLAGDEILVREANWGATTVAMKGPDAQQNSLSLIPSI